LSGVLGKTAYSDSYGHPTNAHDSSILGPALGGALARPCVSYPSLFARNTIFDKFPFLLPNLVCAAILACGVTIGILFLEETHQDLKYRRDYGLEAGQWILRRFQKSPEYESIADKLGVAGMEEFQFLIEDEPPGYRTTEGSPRMPSSRALSPVKMESQRKPRGVQKAFTRQVILNIIGYGILA